MSLSSPVLLWLLGLLTIGLPIVVVTLWSRIRGPRPVVVGSRVGLVLASQLAAVLLMGAAVNDYAYLYGSWGDLWGSLTQPFATHYKVSPVSIAKRSGRAPAAATITRVTTQAGYRQPSRWPRIGRLETVSIYGGASQLRARAYVYLPPQYFQPRYRSSIFPAAEVLSGYPSTNKMLVKRLAFPRTLAREIGRHRARPMVLVLLRPTLTYPRDTECTDVPGGPQVETFYAQDVPAAISGHYRAAPTGWGSAGISTGGYCATKITMTYPTIFRAAVSFSGYYHAVKDYTTGDLWGGSRTLRNLNSPEWRLQHQPAPPVSLLLTSSRDELGPLGYADTRRFVSLARPPLKVATLIAAHGGHVFTTWKPQIPECIRWLSARLSPARPASVTGRSSAATSRFSGFAGRAVPPPAGRAR